MKQFDEKLLSVSVIIPAFNSEKTMGQTLEGLASLDYPQNKIEIIVVDDASTDKTAEIALAHGARVVQRRTKGGCASAKNSGVDHARNEIVAFIDADVLVTKNWLRELVAPFEDKTVGASGGRIKNKFQKDNALEKFIEYDNYYRTRRQNAKSVPGSNSAYRREVFDVVGKMDAYLGEDPDFIYRVVSHGYKAVFVEKAVVYHPFPSGIWTYLRKQVYYAWQRMLILLLRPQCRSILVKDEAAPLSVVLQPFVLLAMILSLMLSPVHGFFGLIAFFLFFFLFIVLNMPFLYYVFNREANIVLFAFIVSILRSLAYIIGMSHGFLSFVKLKMVGANHELNERMIHEQNVEVNRRESSLESSRNLRVTDSVD